MVTKRHAIRLALNIDPMDHQWEGVELALPHKEFAFFCEMGTAKTLMALMLTMQRYGADEIDQLLVVCPTPVKNVWQDEIDKHLAKEMFPTDVFVNTAGNAGLDQWIGRDADCIKVLVVGVESLSQGHAYDKITSFCKMGRTQMVVDESSKIKKHGAPRGRKFYGSRRTYRCYQLGGESEFRLIMTGTEVSQGLHDLYSQFRFLNSGIINCRSWTQFKSRYCVIGAFDEIKGYQFEDHLLGLVKPYVYSKRKREVMDLPPKVFERVYVEPTTEIKVAIKSLETTMQAEQGPYVLEVKGMLERMTRFHQVIGGHFPYKDDEGKSHTLVIEGRNPKIEALREIIELIPKDASVIIWARFRPEIELITYLLMDMKEEYLEFHGGVSETERKRNTAFFQENMYRFMISNAQTGGMGQTWTAATYVIYYSNDFSYENRIQSEDRAHRKGQDNKVTYFDIEMNQKYDKMIHKALTKKLNLAEIVKEAW